MARPRSANIVITYLPRRRVTPYRVRWRGVDADGTWRPFNRHFETEAQAQAFKIAFGPVLVQQALPEPEPASQPTGRAKRVTFRVHAQEWLDEVIARRKPATQANYARLLRVHITPTLGDVLVTPETFTVHTVTHVMNLRAKAGVAWATQLCVLKVLRACLMWAKKWKRLTENPASGLIRDLKDEAYQEPEPNPLTSDQVWAFLTWIKTGRVPADYWPPEQPVERPTRKRIKWPRDLAHWYPYFLTLFLTGIRRNEGTALQWTDVFVERTPATIRIAWTFSRDARRKALAGDSRYPVTGLVKPKGKLVRELTDLPALLIDVLRGLARARRGVAFAGGRELAPFVFLTASGRPITNGLIIDRVFHLGMRALGLTHQRHSVHDLRDTFATLHILAKPGRIARISAHLGHQKVSMTWNRYVKWIRTEPDTMFAKALMPRSPAKAKLEADPDGEND